LKKFELVFMDGTTQEVEASDVQAAWILGKIIAAERGTCLLNIREKS